MFAEFALAGDFVSENARVLSVGDFGMDFRLPRSHLFLPCEIGTDLPEETLVRSTWRFGSEPLELCRLGFPGSRTVDIFPGALVSVKRDEIKLLQGRIKAVLFPEGKIFQIKSGNILFEIQSGEGWVERTPKGDSCFALRKGEGWVKDQTGKINLLVPGKQISVPEFGPPGKPMDIDGHWKYSDTDIVSSLAARKKLEKLRAVNASDSVDLKFPE